MSEVCVSEACVREQGVCEGPTFYISSTSTFQGPNMIGLAMTHLQR